MEFLLKSSLCMMVLLAIYHLFLEREKMHQFNRFYLLFSLAFSFVIPFIVIPVYISTPAQLEAPGSVAMLMDSQLAFSVASGTVYVPKTNYIPYIVWSLYALVTLLLIIKFSLNIGSFIRKIKNNPTIQFGRAKLVLLEEKVLPHTFLNYIFVNREDYQTRMIEEELYTHEYTHVIERHTFDILFIEVLKTIFWFNPLLYIYKKAIQLNHEFLADQKVIVTANTIYYQNLLLEKATVGTTFSMASNLNFSLTKKRLLMMTKTTSTAKAAFLKISITPVIAAIMMLLCTKTVAQKTLSEIPREKIKTLNVYKNVSQQQVDSLRKANPKVYKSKNTGDYAKTDVSYTDKNGKPAKKKFFIEDSAPKKTNASKQFEEEMSGILPEKIKQVSIYKNITQQHVDSLRQANPKVYVSNNPHDYVMTKVEYTDENGNSVKKKFYTQE